MRGLEDLGEDQIPPRETSKRKDMDDKNKLKDGDARDDGGGELGVGPHPTQSTNQI